MISKRFFLSIFILSILSISCSKEEAERLECESQDISYLIINNESDNPYDIYLNGNLVMRMAGKSFVDDYELDAGSNTLRAEQVEGYLIYPTIVEETFVMSQCQTQNWVFP
jgi:hypothetical protein